VDTATDAATDRLVLAESATRRRRYLCRRCHAEVILKSGMKNAAHFAHAKGEAAPDCEDYFPSAFVYRGRRSTWETLETTERPADSLDLYIEVLATGPRLLLWVPPVENEVAWGGVLQITTQRLTRSLTARHLQRGQFVSFDLVDSTWTVSIDGDVPEDYLSRIDVGPGSLETELNLFDATHSPGRKLGAAAAVRLGDAVWLVTRNPPTPTATANSPATCSRELVGACSTWNCREKQRQRKLQVSHASSNAAFDPHAPACG
jgi:Competence protein CoiA-like family